MCLLLIISICTADGVINGSTDLSVFIHCKLHGLSLVEGELSISGYHLNTWVSRSGIGPPGTAGIVRIVKFIIFDVGKSIVVPWN